MGLPRARRGLAASRRRVLAVLLGLFGTWACGPPEHGDAPRDVPPPEALEDNFQPPRPAPVPVAAPVATDLGLSGSFAHQPHAEVRCQTCHADVQGHRSHGELACGECHPAAGAAPTPLLGPEEECQSCHHVRQTVRNCSECHGDLTGRPLPVEQVFDLAVYDTPVTRPLAFDHGRHRERACETCHAPTPAQAVVAGCPDCHSEHHRVQADCVGCHRPSPLAAHDAEAHRGCTGAGCHGAAAADLPRSRTTCLVCHRAQVDHEPDGDCSSCHLFTTDGGPARRADAGAPAGGVG